MEDSPVADEVFRLVEQAKELRETASSLLSRISADEHALRQRVASIDSRISLLCGSKLDDELKEELLKARYVLSEGDAAAFLPIKSHGFLCCCFYFSGISALKVEFIENNSFFFFWGEGRFLRMLLGPINVRASRKDVQLKVKEEYNNFRDRTSYLFLVLPTLLLLLKSWIWDGCIPALPVHLYQAWLLYLYTGLSLRENILRVNGSDIRPWWIKHHYCAMAMAAISLTWDLRGPDCAQKQKGLDLFLKWAMMQGVAMILQNIYQRQRLYTRIALGKARRMDVVWGETAGVEGQLLMLCPILFLSQGFEAYLGVMLLETALAGFSSDWQVIACGVLLIIMAIGNFANTVQTLLIKVRVKGKAKIKMVKKQARIDNKDN